MESILNPRCLATYTAVAYSQPTRELSKIYVGYACQPLPPIFKGVSVKRVYPSSVVITVPDFLPIPEIEYDFIIGSCGLRSWSFVEKKEHKIG